MILSEIDRMDLLAAIDELATYLEPMAKRAENRGDAMPATRAQLARLDVLKTRIEAEP